MPICADAMLPLLLPAPYFATPCRRLRYAIYVAAMLLRYDVTPMLLAARAIASHHFADAIRLFELMPRQRYKDDLLRCLIRAAISA